MTTRLTILGAGPIGIETAARAAESDRFDITVYEAGRIGEYVRRWGHVQMFSPWQMNRSPWGSRLLRQTGYYLADEQKYPTGREFLEEYLMPLADALEDVDFHTHTRVIGLARDQALKAELIGDDARAAKPFVLSVEDDDRRRFDRADVVVDATGVFSRPNALGPSGLPAVGEKKFRDQIHRGTPNLDTDRERFADRRILVVGHGHTAATTLKHLAQLRRRASNTEVVWSFRTDPDPRDVIDDDPLAARAWLDRFANEASRGEAEGIEPIPSSVVLRIERDGERFRVTLDQNGAEREVVVDEIVANVGYRPDPSIHSELQVHRCYATDGPMNLAATLLDADGKDCLDQPSGGIDTLRNPEPDFFILGAKSYGRNSNFLLKTGFEQIETVFEEGDL